jgi:hypothetical protein
VRLIAFGQEAVGVIAIGQVATGVVAIGQVATGVVAIGQLARGVIVIGQLALGVAALGQLAIALVWATGMASVAAFRGPLLLSLGLFGEFHPRQSWRSHRWVGRLERHRGWSLIWRLAVLAVIATLVVFIVVLPLLHELTRVNGIFRSPPPPLR